MKFTKKSFFYTFLGFTQSHSGLLDDPPEGFVQMIPRAYQSVNHINKTGIDERHLKFGCFNGSNCKW